MDIYSNYKLTDFPIFILNNIFNNINYTNHRLYLRSTCKLFYYILQNIMLYNIDFTKKNKFIFKNHNLLKMYSFNLLHPSYISKISHYKNFKLNGLVNIYNINGKLVSKTMFRNNNLHGLSYQYHNGQIINVIEYKNGNKHGNEITFKADNKYVAYYQKNVIKSLKKFTNNNYELIMEKLEPATINIVKKSKFTGNNKITIINDRFSRTSTIFQNDRILQLNFKFGYLDGVQTVTSRDNELKFIGTYILGKLYGKYKHFINGYTIEEGNYSNSGKNLDWCNIHNTIKTIKYKFKDNMLDGQYIENNLISNFCISYRLGNFAGYYLDSSYITDNEINFCYYNENNYTIFKKTKKYSIQLSKKMGIFYLEIKVDPFYKDLDFNDDINLNLQMDLSLCLGEIY